MCMCSVPWMNCAITLIKHQTDILQHPISSDESDNSNGIGTHTKSHDVLSEYPVARVMGNI